MSVAEQVPPVLLRPPMLRPADALIRELEERIRVANMRRQRAAAVVKVATAVTPATPPCVFCLGPRRNGHETCSPECTRGWQKILPIFDDGELYTAHEEPEEPMRPLYRRRRILETPPDDADALDKADALYLDRTRLRRHLISCEA